MVSVTIRDREMRPGERAHIRGDITFGYKETLYPKDVELKTLETISLTSKTREAEPIGSIANPGNIGNSAVIGWATQLGSPLYTLVGTYVTGSKVAYFDIVGG